ncbi:hypothetical protein D3C73_185490 [compost metagenome]
MGMVLKRYSTLRPVTLTKISGTGSNTNISEIEKCLDLDMIEPIKITSADSKDMENDMDYFKGWYEDELREFFEEQ